MSTNREPEQFQPGIHFHRSEKASENEGEFFTSFVLNILKRINESLTLELRSLIKRDIAREINSDEWEEAISSILVKAEEQAAGVFSILTEEQKETVDISALREEVFRGTIISLKAKKTTLTREQVRRRQVDTESVQLARVKDLLERLEKLKNEIILKKEWQHIDDNSK